MTRDEIKESVEGEYVYASNNPSVRVKQVKFLLSEIRELEEGIKEVRAEKDWDAKEFALIELYKLVEEKK